MSEAVGALRRQAKATGVGRPRIPLLLRERFEDVTGSRAIEEL